jgi:hypothetical protein
MTVLSYMLREAFLPADRGWGTKSVTYLRTPTCAFPVKFASTRYGTTRAL